MSNEQWVAREPRMVILAVGGAARLPGVCHERRKSVIPSLGGWVCGARDLARALDVA